MAVKLIFMAWLNVVLDILINDEDILFPVAVKYIFAFNM